jgi:serine/threonine-protein kinase HipA
MGGAKPMALIDIDGDPRVFKLFNNESVDTRRIEHVTMTLAARAGFTVAQTQLIPLVGFNALVILRLDRERNHRIHSISTGTAICATTVRGEEPQMGYP